jgi:hypothetical protein
MSSIRRTPGLPERIGTDSDVLVVISREEVESRDISSVIDVLKSCLSSVERALSLFERLDVVFDGYDDGTREVFEIQHVREYVELLDEQFPYWLFFLTKDGLGLQTIMLSFMPPHLTEQARKTILPRRLDDLLSKRWFPAMNEICLVVGFSEQAIETLTNKVVDYFVSGPLNKSEVVLSAPPPPAPISMTRRYAPDYGLRLLREGISGTVDISFYDFHLFSVTVIGRGQYSTMVETLYEGEIHALSLDFDHAHLARILSKADARLASFLRSELSRDAVSPRSIDLEGHVAFGVRARLGDLQTGASEQFVPLVAQEIL